MRDSVVAARRRRWPIVLPLAVVVVLAALWTGVWFTIAARVPDAISDWRSREASAGRIFGCGTQSIAGFPFRIEVRCSEPSVELADTAPPLAFKAANALLAWQVYQPALVIGEFAAPLALGERGKPASFLVDWSLAQASIRASLEGVERVSIVAERPSVDRVGAGGNPAALAPAMFKADHIELHGRRVAGSPAENPAVDLALRLNAASAPGLHPILAEPLEADAAGVLNGVADMAPNP